MDKEQDDAYNEAIKNYRAASQARLAKTSEINLNNIAAIMPKRQISNYFLEFRKVLKILISFFCISFLQRV